MTLDGGRHLPGAPGGRRLGRTGPEALPTGADLVEQYLRRLAAVPALAPHLRYYERVRSITSARAGDRAAAREVRLDLPETGVCSVTSDADADADAERSDGRTGTGGRRPGPP